MMDKHPISIDQPTRDTLCWREHTPGRVCIRDEGHKEPGAPNPFDEAYIGEVKLYNGNTIKTTPISWNGIKVKTLISTLSEFDENATVEIYCDHYDGCQGSPLQALEISELIK